MANTTPLLTYVGSLDTASVSTNGHNVYKILFDSSLAMLMFEYKFQMGTATNPTPSNLITGFIYPDTAVNDGIVNQYLLPIPIPVELSNTIETNYNISVRVYGTDLTVTNWSNSLAVFNPPEKPEIYTYNEGKAVFYDVNTDSGDDDNLYIVLQSPISTTPVKYIIAYYYKDTNNQTVWKVSGLLNATDVIVGADTVRLLSHNISDDVNISEPSQKIYVAVHAVYSWVVNGVTYHSVSEISETGTAQPAVYASPTNLNGDYNYDNQKIDLSWEAPTTASLPGFTVDTYELYCNDNLITTTSSLSFIHDVFFSFSCGDELSYYVIAVNSSGQTSAQSNTFTKTKYTKASAPSDMNIDWAVFTSSSKTSVDFVFSFANPSALGCGTPDKYHYEIFEAGTKISEGNGDYVSGPARYVVSINDLSVTDGTTSLNVDVWFTTLDPNNNNSPTAGSSDSGTVTLSLLPLIKNFSRDADAGVWEFEVYSSQLLKPVGQIAHRLSSGLRIQELDTTLVTRMDVIGTYKYEFSISVNDTAEFNNGGAIFVSNDAGIGSYLVMPST